ncbi:MAG TPA: shikimate dehydrogenase, partial [bacterium]|nr:shikimate dehydrogenase [bacterium]
MINDWITGTTTLYGIMGYPVSHSLSPIIHNTAFHYLKIASCYVPWNVFPEKFETALRGAQALGIKGLNITIPHKETALYLCDMVSDEARAIGAVNTIVFTENLIRGYNTDAYGFFRALQTCNIDQKNKNILILGAGGGARAVAYALGNFFPESTIFISNRTTEKANKLVKHFNNMFEKNDLFRSVTASDMKTIQFSLVVNTTPPQSEHFDEQLFKRYTGTAIDIAYSINDTPFLSMAKKHQWIISDGLEMLLFQAAQSFNLWTNKLMPID